jgi:hypothetical protein
MVAWFSKSSGPFNVTLSNVYIEGLAKLEVDRGGQLQAQNIEMDIVFKDIAMNFQNLGWMGSIFQVCTTIRFKRNADFTIFIFFRSDAVEFYFLLEIDAVLLGNWYQKF